MIIEQARRLNFYKMQLSGIIPNLNILQGDPVVDNKIRDEISIIIDKITNIINNWGINYNTIKINNIYWDIKDYTFIHYDKALCINGMHNKNIPFCRDFESLFLNATTISTLGDSMRIYFNSNLLEFKLNTSYWAIDNRDLLCKVNFVNLPSEFGPWYTITPNSEVKFGDLCNLKLIQKYSNN